MRLIIKLVIYSLSIIITAYLLPGIHISDNTSLIVLAVVLIILRTVVKPILQLLTLPLNLVTFGLFGFIINILIIITASLIVPGFKIDNIYWAIMFSFILSIIVSILESIDNVGSKIR